MCLLVWVFLEVSKRLLLLLYCLVVASVTAVIGVGLVVSNSLMLLSIIP